MKGGVKYLVFFYQDMKEILSFMLINLNSVVCFKDKIIRNS